MDFLTFQVRAAIVGNYKDSRLYGRGDDYAETVIANAIAHLNENKEIVIGSFESKSGEEIRFVLAGGCLTLYKE